ncbi:MAG: hypothetical protein ACPG5P_00285 [Saprospiraceae bacterium]
MKVLAFILAIFFISTAFAPIFQGQSCSEQANQEQSSEEKNCCEGLCLCVCCALFTAAPEIKKLSQSKEIIKAWNSFHEEQVLAKSFSSETWRPPNV